MAKTSKGLSERDSRQIDQHIYNEVNASVTVDGFVVGKVGHKVERALGTTNVANDTEVFTFSDGGTVLYVISVVYTDDTLGTLLSVERTA